MEHLIFKDEAPNLTTLRIDGSRIYLVSNHPRFAEDIFREFSEDITRYMIPKPNATVAQAQAFIDQSIANMQARKELVMAICLQTDDSFLGMCGLHGDRSEGKGQAPELGIWLKAPAHGHGYGREAIHTLVTWAQQHLVLQHFVYPVDKANTPSRKIPESLGGVVVGEKDVTNQVGNVLHEVIYHIPVA